MANGYLSRPIKEFYSTEEEREIRVFQLVDGSFAFIELNSILYLTQVTFITGSCLRIKFIETSPNIEGLIENQIWIQKNKFHEKFKIVEIIGKEHIRNLKIESIS
jgi:hypothetical protein